MKPFDGGGWRGVSRINNRDDLHQAYDESGEMLMHLQATVDYEHFARALSIGPETMVMDFRPDEPMHHRYAVSHGFLGESAGNADAWRSRGSSTPSSAGSSTPARCSSPGDEVYPIDYANACPDVAVTSLHYYFPWAITALVRWSVFCAGRPAGSGRVDLHTAAYFDIADDESLSYDAKITAYLALADEHFDTARYWQWCDEYLPHLEEQVHDWVTSARLRAAAPRDRRRDVPRARAGPVHGPLPRPADLWAADNKHERPHPEWVRASRAATR